MRAQTQEMEVERWALAPESLEAAQRHAVELANRLASERTLSSIGGDLSILVDEIGELSEAMAVIEPVLAAAMFTNALELAKVLGREDQGAWEQANLSVQSIAQGLEVLLDGAPAALAGIDPKQAARWLANALRPATQAQLSDLLGIGERTLQHWLSAQDPSRPDGSNFERMQRLLLVVGRLRHVFTSQGLMEWLAQPIPALRKLSPAQAIKDDPGFQSVMRIAAGLRAA